MNYLLNYHGKEITADMYAVETEHGQPLETFTGVYAYMKALIYCEQMCINGYIIYPLTRVRQRIVNGYPVKRGRKPGKSNNYTAGRIFSKQVKKAPGRMANNLPEVSGR